MPRKAKEKTAVEVKPKFVDKMSDLEDKVEARTSFLAENLNTTMASVKALNDLVLAQAKSIGILGAHINVLEGKIKSQNRFITACLLCIIILGIKILMSGV